MNTTQTKAQKLSDQCDIEDAFKTACRRKLLRLNALNKELLEALKQLVDDKHPELIPSYKWKQARDAIAKATKETI